jgi:hypothetical protein
VLPFQNEEEYIYNQWQDNFLPLHNYKAAIYGIGKNTKHILENFTADNVIALLDGTRIGETMYNRPIVSIETAFEMGVTYVVIIARASNVQIIYRRISVFCEQHKIKVYNIDGKLIDNKNNEIKVFDEYVEISEQV